MKKKKSLFEQKLILQIISIIAAIILWFAITYSENPSVAIPINNISINFIGEKVLDKNGLIFVNRDKLPNIVIEVRGKRSEVQSILNSVSATVDLSDITEAGEYVKDISYEVPNQAVMISKKKTTSVTVVIEKSVSKEVPVNVVQNGSNKDYLIKSTPAISKMNIAGTSEDLAKINSVSVSVDISGMKEDCRDNYPIIYTDLNNNAVVPANHISHGRKTIEVENEVYFKKTVKIELSPEYDRDNYQINVKGFSTEKLDIGVRDESQNIETVYAQFKDNTEIKQDGKYEMSLMLPENVYCPQLPKELIMTANIENIVTKDISVKVECVNIPQDMTAVCNPEFLNVTATGTEESLAQLKAVVDLVGLEAGDYSLAAAFEGNASINGSYMVNVNLTSSEKE